MTYILFKQPGRYTPSEQGQAYTSLHYHTTKDQWHMYKMTMIAGDRKTFEYDC